MEPCRERPATMSSSSSAETDSRISKIRRVQELWDRIADSQDDVGLTDAQRLELERRLEAHEDDPGNYHSWSEIRRRLLGES